MLRGSPALVLALPLLVGCGTDRRDAHCGPDAPGIEDDPECIYPRDGLQQVLPGPCAPVSGAPPATCPTFAEVSAVLTDTGKGGCTIPACHGLAEDAALDIVLSADPAGLYQALTTVTGSNDTPYVVPDDPATAENEALGSWMLCNVASLPGGGFAMPPPGGLTAQADIEVVRGWLLCGAPPP